MARAARLATRANTKPHPRGLWGNPYPCRAITGTPPAVRAMPLDPASYITLE